MILNRPGNYRWNVKYAFLMKEPKYDGRSKSVTPVRSELRDPMGCHRKPYLRRV